MKKIFKLVFVIVWIFSVILTIFYFNVIKEYADDGIETETVITSTYKSSGAFNIYNCIYTDSSGVERAGKICVHGEAQEGDIVFGQRLSDSARMFTLSVINYYSEAMIICDFIALVMLGVVIYVYFHNKKARQLRDELMAEQRRKEDEFRKKLNSSRYTDTDETGEQ